MISLVIAYYKNLETLEILLQGYSRQSEKDFEVIIAEDAQDVETIEFLEEWKTKNTLKLNHVSQADKGFRKTLILNKAIAISKGDFIIFTDGDCVPHKHFIRTYKNAQREGYALFGRRVMLSEAMTNKIIEEKSLKDMSPFSLIGKAKKLKYGFYLPFIKQVRYKGILGCNWGVAKKELNAINGFDEAYIQAGVGEDVDIEWRLIQNGVKLLSVRFNAIVYHLHHKEHYSDIEVNKGFAILDAKKKLKAEEVK